MNKTPVKYYYLSGVYLVVYKLTHCLTANLFIYFAASSSMRREVALSDEYCHVSSCQPSANDSGTIVAPNNLNLKVANSSITLKWSETCNSSTNHYL